MAVWNKAMDLVIKVYKLTDYFPQSELYGLSSQMRRCAVSIPSNIAEGYRRYGKQEFHHFLTYSFGSGGELETQLDIAEKLGYVKSNDYLNTKNLLNEVMKLLHTMLRNK